MTLRRWPGLAVATAVVAVGAGAAGVPSPALFAAILTGLVWALGGAGEMAPPRWAAVAAQAVIGATLGAYFELAPLTALGGRWLPVGLVVAGTLAASLLAGMLVVAAGRCARPGAGARVRRDRCAGGPALHAGHGPPRGSAAAGGARGRRGNDRPLRRLGGGTRGAGRRDLCGRLSGHHARRHLRRGGDRRGQRRGHDVRHRGPGAADADHGARRSAATPLVRMLAAAGADRARDLRDRGSRSG